MADPSAALVVLALQILLAVCYTVFVVFRCMGRDYEAAVTCAGFGGIALGKRAWKYIDAGLIDGVLVNGTANLVGHVSRAIRGMQTGRLTTYAFAMILGLIVLLAAVARLFAL